MRSATGCRRNAVVDSMTSRSELVESLKDKEYRDLYVAERINVGLAYQIREMRGSEDMTQRLLAAKAGMHQATISELENPNYGAYTISTLKRLASVFDVALEVRFVPFSTLVDEDVRLTNADLSPDPHGKDELLDHVRV